MQSKDSLISEQKDTIRTSVHTDTKQNDKFKLMFTLSFFILVRFYSAYSCPCKNSS